LLLAQLRKCFAIAGERAADAIHIVCSH
jgi:hypothetical protein